MSPHLQSITQRFGSETVTGETRRARVRAMFDGIAPSYDLMNDLMSGGMHRLWKRRAAAFAVSRAGSSVAPLLDLAAGTGDLAQIMAARLPGREIVMCDASPRMLAVADARAIPAGRTVVGEGEHLPFVAEQFACVTLAFGLRNMTDPIACLRDIHRVLMPGGTLVILEFSQPSAWFAPFYRLYSSAVIPRLGAAVARDRQAYGYLIESIRDFPDVAAVSAALATVGFAVDAVDRLMFGAVAIHVARKPGMVS